MIYQIEFKPRALRELRAINRSDVSGIIEKIRLLRNDLTGNVKRLTNFTPEYRLRVGSYRILFEVEGEKVVIYRIRHRKDGYS